MPKLYKNEHDKYKYIGNIFETMILRDIKQKYKIRNENLLKIITDFLTDNIGNITSAKKLTDEINSLGNKIDCKTTCRYLEYLCRAFAFYRVKRYDIKGKKYLSSSEKYYLNDHSFGYALLGTKNPPPNK